MGRHWGGGGQEGRQAGTQTQPPTCVALQVDQHHCLDAAGQLHLLPPGLACRLHKQLQPLPHRRAAAERAVSAAVVAVPELVGQAAHCEVGLGLTEPVEAVCSLGIHAH